MFPPRLLEQINECSNGAFILFNFDDQGQPQIFGMVDNPICGLAIQGYINNWSKATEAFNVESSISEIAKQSRKK